MISATITVTPNGGESDVPPMRTGTVTIQEMAVHPDGTADYVIYFSVDRVSGVGRHRRSILHFPKDQFNHLALLRQALMTLDEEELRNDGKTLS